MARAKQMVTFVVDTDLPERRQATALAAALLNRGATWNGSDLVVPANLFLTPEQARLITDHLNLAKMIVPNVAYPAFCDRCGRIALQSGAAASAKCHLTVGCNGKLLGTSPAKAL